MTEIIAGDGVTLVPVTAADVDAVLAGNLGRRSAGPGWPHDDTATGLGHARDGAWSWLICDGDGRVVGDCGAKALPDSGSVEIGYGLAAPSRGRGLGSRAVGALVEWLLARPDVSVVTAEVDVGNLASRRLLERLGFVVADVYPAYVSYRRSR